jgi:ABC-2 type transport system ATP-binding protein
VVKAVHTERQSRLLVHTKAPLTDPAWDVSDVGLEEVVLAYMSDDGSVTAGSLSLVGGKR